MRVELLSPASAPAFQGLTFPAYQALLADSACIAIGAVGSRPVGMALAKPASDKNLLDVLSVYVEKSYRDQGIATRMVEAVIAESRRRGYGGLRTQYRAPKPALERVLAKTGWTASAPYLTTYKTDARIRATPLLELGFELDDSYEIFGWSELAAEDRLQIDALLEQEPLPSQFVSPWLEAERVEPLNSLGVRFQGRVVGWSLTHRLDPQTIRYSGIFVHPGHRGLKGMGVSLCLLIESIQRHLPHATAEIPFASFVVRHDNPFMPSIASRYLAPYAFEKQEMRYAAYVSA